MSERRTSQGTGDSITDVGARRAGSAMPRHRLPKTSVLVLAAVALVAAACDYDPAALTGNRAWSECLGEQATIGHGWNPLADPPEGVSYEGTEGDDVVVITNGPVTFDGLGGNDLICINDTGLGSPGPVVIDAGDGDDQVWDRRHRHGEVPADVVLNVELGDGDDRFYGSAARDVVDAGDGDDEVNGGGGIDDVDCGDGTDLRWTGDHTDPSTTAVGCENADTGYGPVDEAAITAIVDAYHADTYSFGARVAVRVPGQPDTLALAGVNDKRAETATPMPLDGTFHIASITKTFTSAVALQLIEEGLLDFDDTLDQWAPTYPHAAGITVRMMLEHTSGMVDIYNDGGAFVPYWFDDPTRQFSPGQVLEFSAILASYASPPTEFRYTNGGYWAIGHVIEQITGKPIHEVLRERIFDPHGLDQTELDRGTANITHHGWGGFGLGNPNLGTFDPSVPRNLDWLLLPRTSMQTFSGPVGGGVSSLGDLLDWGEIIYGGQFLGDELDAELHTLNHDDNEYGEHEERRYGLGVTGFCPCDTPTDPPILGHHGVGSYSTSSSIFVHHADLGVSIAAYSNSRVALVARDQLVQDLLAEVTP